MTKNEENKNTDAVELFLNNFSAFNTIDAYRKRLKHFFEFLGKDPNEYVKGNQDYQNDVKLFVQTIKHKAPISQKCYINTIKKFLEEYEGLELRGSVYNLFDKDYTSPWNPDLPHDVPRAGRSFIIELKYKF